MSTPTWYRDAVIYEVRVQSFMDSDGDGVGDLRGLIDRLDYLQELGVTALWLLPLCPSPGRDDGYDIADYTDIHPQLGTLDDFRALVAAAHRRGLKVITELVLNHTSDQHAWFQRARRAPAGSPERDWYVWSESPDRYRGVRIIFSDTEPSNWTWDPVAGAYYWHRFFHHQPDLNFDNPEVRQALLEVLDFWLALGVDGLRLDAVPYLFEREGTSCENLPETLGFLKELRAFVDGRYPGRMLLAEANQWPEDAVAYFGDGDACHMNFHFPLMPRLYMAVHAEDRLPIVDILAQTPELPEGGQWAIFLRNHDELTLEMVTEEEREEMWATYAPDPRMRLNLGIRRRLAPLVGGDRRTIELLYGLLLSMPGTPVLYYGDELGMGDNIRLGDRNGVRTPMQWSGDRNAGFSSANPQELVFPVITDPAYHYAAVNAEAQRSQPGSLLRWVQQLLTTRHRTAVFGRGAITFLHPADEAVLAYVREHEDEAVLVVANLSRTPRSVHLDLSRWAGARPLTLPGDAPFPEVGTEPWPLTLAGHGFLWLALTEVAPARPPRREEVARTALPGSASVVLTRPAAGVGWQVEAHLAPEPDWGPLLTAVGVDGPVLRATERHGGATVDLDVPGARVRFYRRPDRDPAPALVRGRALPPGAPVRPIRGAVEVPLRRGRAPITVAVAFDTAGEQPAPDALTDVWRDRLGTRLGELHLALAAACVPGSAGWTPFAQRSWAQSVRNGVGHTLRQLERAVAQLRPEAAVVAEQVLGRGAAWLDGLDALQAPIGAARSAVLWDPTLADVALVGDDVRFVDLDGDRRRLASDRMRSGSALRDAVALGVVEPWLRRVSGTPLAPSDPAELDRLLRIHRLEVALDALRRALRRDTGVLEALITLEAL